MSTAKRGEVWIADLGYAAKVRPVLILSIPYSDQDYALLTVIPHTTSIRESAFEVQLSVRGLKFGVFNVQGLLGVPPVKLLRKIARLSPEQMRIVDVSVEHWLGLMNKSS